MLKELKLSLFRKEDANEKERIDLVETFKSIAKRFGHSFEDHVAWSFNFQFLLHLRPPYLDEKV